MLENWQGVISDEFTFDNVRKHVGEIAASLKTDRPLIIGYDARFLADKFAEEVVKVMEESGIDCLLVERDTPTPVTAWEVKDRHAAGAVMITGENLPAEYCGIRFVQGISGNIREYRGKSGKVERFEPRERYLTYVSSWVDAGVIKKAKLKVMVDPMYGSGRGYLDKLLQQLGCQVEEIHNYRDVLFGGMAPDSVEENLSELKEKVVQMKANIGIALSGDAQLCGIIDERGNYKRSDGKQSDGMLEALLEIEKLGRSLIK